MQPKKLTMLVLAILAPAFGPGLVAQTDLSRTRHRPHYRLVDMGTFGGPVSLVVGGTGNLNQRKTLVTSSADTASPDPDTQT